MRQPDVVVSRVASIVGVAEEGGRPLLETLAEALRPRTMLLALDNCEHLIDACAQLCQRLLASSAGLRIIVTSREPLRVAAEAVWQVQPLSLPPDAVTAPAEIRNYESIRLFAERAAAAQPGFDLSAANAGSIAAICRALDGVPLAIELAAAWVRALSADQIAARLDDRFQLLTSGDRTAPARQRTLRATIDWSHDLLGALRTGAAAPASASSPDGRWRWPSRSALMRIFRRPRILDLVAGLVDKSLVVVEPEALGQTRYRLLDTIRDYAAQRLAEAGEVQATRARLRDYVLAWWSTTRRSEWR